MTDTDDTPEESNENDQISQEKNERLDRERTTLLSHLTEFKLEDMRTKVAFILNQYSSTRDSDMALTIKYWEVFHPDLIGNDAVSFENLYKLPKFNSISIPVRPILSSAYVVPAKTPFDIKPVVNLFLGIEELKII